MEDADDGKQIPGLKMCEFGGHVITKCCFSFCFTLKVGVLLTQ